MTAKEWKRRINKAYQAKNDGDLGLLDSICEELERLTESPQVPPPVPETMNAVTPVVPLPVPETVIFG